VNNQFQETTTATHTHHITTSQTNPYQETTPTSKFEPTMIPTLIFSTLLSTTQFYQPVPVTDTPTVKSTSTIEGISKIYPKEISNKCDNYDCHIEEVPSDFCTVPVKGPYDYNCEIPCQIDNCTKEIEFGNTCLDFVCEPKSLFSNSIPSPVIPTSSEAPLTTTFITNTEFLKSTEATQKSREATQSTEATQKSCGGIQDNLQSKDAGPKIREATSRNRGANRDEDPCDNFDCQVESVPSDFCTVPVKGPYDINCWIPCSIDNCTKDIEPGNTCLEFICVPKPTPPGPPPPPGPVPPTPGPVPPPEPPRNHDALVIAATFGK